MIIVASTKAAQLIIEYVLKNNRIICMHCTWKLTQKPFQQIIVIQLNLAII